MDMDSELLSPTESDQRDSTPVLPEPQLAPTITSAVAFSGVVFCGHGEEDRVRQLIEEALKDHVRRDHLVTFKSTSVREKKKKKLTEEKQLQKRQDWGPQRVFVPDAAASVNGSRPLIPWRPLRQIVTHRWWTVYMSVSIFLVVALTFIGFAVDTSDAQFYCSIASTVISYASFPFLISQYSRKMVWNCVTSFDYVFMMSEFFTYILCAGYIRYYNLCRENIVLTVTSATGQLLWVNSLLLLDASTASKRLKGVAMSLTTVLLVFQTWFWGRNKDPIATTQLDWHPYTPKLNSLISASALTMAIFTIRYALACLFPRLGGGDALMFHFAPKEVHLQAVVLPGSNETEVGATKEEKNNSPRVVGTAGGNETEVEAKREEGSDSPRVVETTGSPPDSSGTEVHTSAPKYLAACGWSVPQNYSLVFSDVY